MQNIKGVYSLELDQSDRDKLALDVLRPECKVALGAVYRLDGKVVEVYYVERRAGR